MQILIPSLSSATMRSKFVFANTWVYKQIPPELTTFLSAAVFCVVVMQTMNTCFV